MTRQQQDEVVHRLAVLADAVRELPEGERLAAIRREFFGLTEVLTRHKVIPAGEWRMGSRKS